VDLEDRYKSVVVWIWKIDTSQWLCGSGPIGVHLEHLLTVNCGANVHSNDLEGEGGEGESV
jgi:hypothetical protein